MSFFGKLFGAEKSVDKLTTGIYNGVDKLVFTDEEKKELFLKQLKLYEPFKLAQRYMMLIIGIPFVSVHSLVALIRLVLAFMGPGYADVSLNIGKALIPFNEALATPFFAVAAFYFAGGAINGFRGGK